MKYFFQDKIIWAAINMYFVAQKLSIFISPNVKYFS